LIRFEHQYDPAKNDRNIRQRGLSFERVADFDFGRVGVRYKGHQLSQSEFQRDKEI
jgi:uncharacterized DUF497 family protein